MPDPLRTAVVPPRSLLLIALAAVGVCMGPVSGQSTKPSVAGNDQVAEVLKTFKPRGVQSDGSSPTDPQQSIETFALAEGFSIDLIASEPEISQPLFLSWDSRGRMWVVEYRQYQYPAGLKVVRFDQHLRAVFDKVPEPPPHGTPGKDRITVFEDSDGDGRYDTSKTVISGLNIASSVAVGRGGIWVMNPPYLLFYPDADGDDVPDSDPEVQLSGFGLQDTHSVANSLMFGPDGWLYGANGSTTGGTVSSAATRGVTFLGQCIWRYHPATKVFEIYAEGGGNTFSLDIDSKGRVFSGTNGGNTRGWYYPQGSYSHKNWGKHGPLTNPYAFGFFGPMKLEGDKRRFAQALAVYEGGLFGAPYEGSFIAPNSMLNVVWNSSRIRDGSTYRTVDRPDLAVSTDRWFRPVYCGVGPDGGVYVADWYDTRLSHVSPTDDWHKDSGRVYRIRPANSNPAYSAGDLSKLSAGELVKHFESPNKWIRQRASLELGWRGDDSVTEDLLSKIRTRGALESGTAESGALESLWSLNAIGELTSSRAAGLLEHQDPNIRRWVVRLLGDRHESVPELVALADREADIQVRSQLASSAARIDAATGLEIAAALLRHSGDATDPHQPLMVWWAIERHCDDWPAIKSFVADSTLWKLPIFADSIVPRLMQRYGAPGTAVDLQHCSELLELAPDADSRDRLISGFNQAYQGRQLPPLSSTLSAGVAAYRSARGTAGVVLGIKQGDADVIGRAVKILGDRSADVGLRAEIASALGEFRFDPAVSVLLRLATGSEPDHPSLQRVSLRSLALYDDDRIPVSITRGFGSSISREHELRATGCRTLASRKTWALALLEELAQWRLHKTDVPADVIQRLRAYDDLQVSQLVDKVFGKAGEISSPEQVAEIHRLTKLLNNRDGDVAAGKVHFEKKCATCHQLLGAGQTIGPKLDAYDRDDLKFWLPAIVAPSIEIREGYQSYLAITDAGRVITGTIAAQDPLTVSLRTADNQTVVLERIHIERLRALKTSLMPADLLKDLSDEDCRNLFAYLRMRP